MSSTFYNSDLEIFPFALDAVDELGETLTIKAILTSTLRPVGGTSPSGDTRGPVWVPLRKPSKTMWFPVLLLSNIISPLLQGFKEVS